MKAKRLLPLILALVAMVSIACNSGLPTNDYQAFITAVESLSQSTEVSGADIDLAEALYEMLTETDKQNPLVIEAKETLDLAREAYQNEIKIREFLSAVEGLGTITSQSATKLETADTRYNALNEASKQDERVVTAKQELDEKWTIFTSLSKNKAFINAVSAIGEVTLESSADIAVADSAYASLSEAEKQEADVIKAKTTLEQKRATYNSLVRIEAFINSVNAIGTVTLQSGADITSADDAYALLETADKNVQTVKDAKAALEGKREQFNVMVAEKAFIDAISAISTPVTVEHRNAIEQARRLYDLLGEASKAKGTISTAFGILETLEYDLYLAQHAAEAEYINLVENLGEMTVTETFRTKALNILSVYNGLTQSQKNSQLVLESKADFDVKWIAYRRGQLSALTAELVTLTANSNYTNMAELNSKASALVAERNFLFTAGEQEIYSEVATANNAIAAAQAEYASLVAANAFITEVNGLEAITTSSTNQEITNAKTAYANAELTYQALVSANRETYPDVADAYSDLIQLNAEYVTVIGELATAYKTLVDSFGTITKASLDGINALISAYSNLHPDVAELSDATTALQTAQGYVGEYYEIFAQEFADEVDTLEISLADGYTDIMALLSKFDNDLADEITERTTAIEARDQLVGLLDDFSLLVSNEFVGRVDEVVVALDMDIYNQILALIEEYDNGIAERYDSVIAGKVHTLYERSNLVNVLNSFNDMVETDATDFANNGVSNEVDATVEYRNALEAQLTAYSNLFSMTQEHSIATAELNRLNGLKAELSAIAYNTVINSYIQYTSFERNTETNVQTFTLEIVAVLEVINVYGAFINVSEEVTASYRLNVDGSESYSELITVIFANNKYTFKVEGITEVGKFDIKFLIAGEEFINNVSSVSINEPRLTAHGMTFDTVAETWGIGGGEFTDDSPELPQANALGFTAIIFNGGYTVQGGVIIPQNVIIRVPLSSSQLSIAALKDILAHWGYSPKYGNGDFGEVYIAIIRNGGTIGDKDYSDSPILAGNSLLIFGGSETYHLSIPYENAPIYVGEDGVMNMTEQGNWVLNRGDRVLLDQTRLEDLSGFKIYVYTSNQPDANARGYFYVTLDADNNYSTLIISSHKADGTLINPDVAPDNLKHITNSWCTPGDAKSMIATMLPGYSVGARNIYLRAQVIANPNGIYAGDSELSEFIKWDTAVELTADFGDVTFSATGNLEANKVRQPFKGISSTELFDHYRMYFYSDNTVAYEPDVAGDYVGYLDIIPVFNQDGEFVCYETYRYRASDEAYEKTENLTGNLLDAYWLKGDVDKFITDFLFTRDNDLVYYARTQLIVTEGNDTYAQNSLLTDYKKYSYVVAGSGTDPDPNPDPDSDNLALGATALASSELGGNIAQNAIDGNTGTSWESVHADAGEYTQTLTLEFRESITFNKIVILWENARADNYTIQISDNNENWSDLLVVTGAEGNTNTLEFASSTAKYVRVFCQNRALNNYGYRIFELSIYNEAPEVEEGE